MSQKRDSLMHPWRRFLARFRYDYAPIAVDATIALSTHRARRRLSRQNPIGLLVDNCVIERAVTHETAWISTGKAKWGPHEIDTGYCARIPVHAADADSENFRNIAYLPGIACLARAGYLSLMTSTELDQEQFRQPMGRYRGYGLYDYSLFSGIHFKTIRDGGNDAVSGLQPYDRKSAAEGQRARLMRSNDQLYRALLRQLGQASSQDSWHIRTAEVHGLFCFLTMDFKLRRNFESRSRQLPIRSLTTRVMTPLEFGKYFGLMPLHPRLLSYHGASYPVRADLFWPEGKRQRWRPTRPNSATNEPQRRRS